MFDVLRICMKLPIFYLRSTQTHRRCNAGLDSFSGGTKPVCVQPATSTSDYSGASNGRGAESYKILGDGAKVEGKSTNLYASICSSIKDAAPSLHGFSDRCNDGVPK